IAPIAVVQVAGDEHKRDALADGQLNQVIESLARGTAQLLDRRAFVAFEPEERAIEMDVGRVNKTQHGGSFYGTAEPRRSVGHTSLCIAPCRSRTAIRGSGTKWLYKSVRVERSS